MEVIPWVPSPTIIKEANLTHLMEEKGFLTVSSFHHYSVSQYEDFWQTMLKKLDISFEVAPKKICDLSRGLEDPQWFTHAKMNIVDSCFNAPPASPAIIYLNESHELTTISYGELQTKVRRIAASLQAYGFKKGDVIAIILSMGPKAVALYLSIILMGGIVVSIADSFSSEEIALRLKISHAKAIFTQSRIKWGKKLIPLYPKVKKAAKGLPIIILGNERKSPSKNTILWEDFLKNKTTFQGIHCNPMDICHILFSSGTSGIPKAIPWLHLTPIKAASDAYLHHNIKRDDILAWPTNLGWMMGPWLVFASLINKACMALYPDTPNIKAFGEFVASAKVTLLGVVPSLVATWKHSQCMESCDWKAIRAFSSTGECSNPADMQYLMSLAGGKPIIEYCGGTEIGGAYISSTLIETNYPSLFSTPTMGCDFIILDEKGQLADKGEVALIPPALGFSTTLLNADHHEVYFAHMPLFQGKKLRRHGDEIKRLPNGYYELEGRMDDTMNLNGIKVSAAEIERSFAGMLPILEVAAIAVSSPSKLVIFAVAATALSPSEKEKIHLEMQHLLSRHLNPLFKIHDIVWVDSLPKTASNKIMRRLLRKGYRLGE